MIKEKISIGILKLNALALAPLGFFTKASAQETPSPLVPIESVTPPMILVTNIIQWILLAAGILAVIFLIYGGVQYIIAGGDQEKAGKGRQTLLNAIIGIVIILVAYVIVRVIQNAVTFGTFM